MASLKFSSSIEHVCLQEWKLSASWLQGTSVLEHLQTLFYWQCCWYLQFTITQNAFASTSSTCLCCLPYVLSSLAVFAPTISISIHSFSLHFPLFLPPLCPGILPAVSSRDLCPYRHNEISQSSLPPLWTCTWESCIQNRSTYTRPWGMTWGSSNRSSLQGL